MTLLIHNVVTLNGRGDLLITSELLIYVVETAQRTLSLCAIYKVHHNHNINSILIIVTDITFIAIEHFSVVFDRRVSRSC